MKLHLEELSRRVIGCAIEVHRSLGSGLLESAYQQCLAHELTLAKIPFRTEVNIPLEYKGVKLACGYRADFVVDGTLLLELKSIEQFNKVHEAQLLNYMKIAGIKVGLLINFNVTILKKGLKRFIL